MLSMRVVLVLWCLLCLAACASADDAAGSLASTDAYVHRQLDRRGL